MTLSLQPRGGRTLLRHALAMALAAGLGGALLDAAPALAKDKEQAPAAPKISLSGKFAPVYQETVKKIEAAKARPDVVAAGAKYSAAADGASQKAAAAELAGLLGAERSQVQTAVAAATTPDDHYAAGQLELTLGQMSHDNTLTSQGLKDMIASGKDPADTGKFEFYVANFAYEDGNYPDAISAMEAAKAAGFQNDQLGIVLADSYIKNKQLDKGLPALQAAIDANKAAGQPVPASWYRVGVVSAYNAKMLDAALRFGMGLVSLDPTSKNWALVLEVLEAVGHYDSQEQLDLLRLMARTHSFAQKTDYLEYIQAADARRLPGEVLDVIAAGEAAGKLSPGDPSVADARAVAQAHVTADRASLPGLEHDARAPGATALVASAAADAMLSYGHAQDAVELYGIALGKPGVDAPRVLTRLGIAQTDAGDLAGAQATFAKVTGPRQPLAQLWSIYAQTKAQAK